ncbi:MAG: hypothetical protein LBP31_01855 [Holosporales bacterium]|jgi:lipopolysaccharide biosynthesis glycosyltransferase|nr:hypothetical protein [Holosporales bacterium]
MKKLLLSIAIVLGGWRGLTYSSSLPATTQRYSTQLPKSFNINEVELSFIDLPGYQKADISGPVVPWNKLGTYDQSEIINIVYVSDEKYLPYTYTSLISILDNSKPEERNEPIRFTIILDEVEFKGILDDDMTRLTNVLFFKFNRDIYKYDIEYIPIPDRERERINQFETYWNLWPKNIFLKLFFSNFLSCDKCIYLDGDTACVSDIRRLWNIDLGKHCFGGTEYFELANRYKEKIFNAGMLLFNLKRMREVGFATEIEEIFKEGQKNPKMRYLEEFALKDYSKKHGHYPINQEFNMGIEDNIPKRYTNENNDNLKISLIHFCSYFKPQKFIQKYEAAGCPNYKNLQHTFWKLYKYSSWAFVQCYKYYKHYEEINDLAKLE